MPSSQGRVVRPLKVATHGRWPRFRAPNSTATRSQDTAWHRMAPYERRKFEVNPTISTEEVRSEPNHIDGSFTMTQVDAHLCVRGRAALQLPGRTKPPTLTHRVTT